MLDGFFCSLGVVYRGLGISKVQFLIKKHAFFQLNFFSIFGHRNPGSRTGSGSAIRKNAGSGYASNQFPSATLDDNPFVKYFFSVP
jgi:hypothetical protein